MAQLCTRCGKSLPPNARFCGNCGQSLQGQPATAQPDPALALEWEPQAPKANKKRSGKRTAVSVLIVAVVLAALAAAFLEGYLRRMLPEKALAALMTPRQEEPAVGPEEFPGPATEDIVLPEGADAILDLAGTYYALTGDAAVELELNVTGDQPYARLRYGLDGAEMDAPEYAPNGGDLLFLDYLGDGRWQSEIQSSGGSGTLTLTASENNEVFVAVEAGSHSLPATRVETAADWLGGAYGNYALSASWIYDTAADETRALSPLDCEQILRKNFYGTWYGAEETLTMLSGETKVFGLTGSDYQGLGFMVTFLPGSGATRSQLAHFSGKEDGVLTIGDAVYYADPEDAPQADYLLPDSDSRFLTEEDLEDLTWEECCLARNEIYARHGRIFSTPELAAYFEMQTWYVGRISGPEFDAVSTTLLNGYERANIRFLSDYEQATYGGSYY